MKKQQAINLAIDAIKHQIQKIAVDANLYDHKLADYPFAQKSSELKKKLLEAIDVLEELKRDN